MHLAHTTDKGIGTQANFGLIVLQTDETIESEMARMMDIPGVVLYHSRIPMQTEVSSETLVQMEKDLPASAALFPTSLNLDVIGYGCTSAATVIGPDGVANAIRSARPESKVTDPISAALSACRFLGATRIGFVTPYVAEVSAKMRGMLEQNGHEVVAFGSFNESDDRVVARITPDSILAAIEAVDAEAECDAVFVACTNLRVAGIVEEAERRIGKPVLSSNSALAWHMQKLAEITPSNPRLGVLFTNPSGVPA
ncbi:MAG: aspartate/glutamate racemase family protein [Sneathiella sp.]|uniref:maleate cis-trans isomerase family protein n=1 Tax=Sneathiella sp. TaxID=1964365 RepID=UPI0030021041